MNCYSCNKELNNLCVNYCVHCGAELKECGNVHAQNFNQGTSEFCCSSTNENSNTYDNGEHAKIHKNNINKLDLSKIKETIMKNKVVSIVICAILILGIGGYGTLSYINGLPPKANTIKKDILGTTINIYGKNVTIEDKNLKSFKLIKKETLKKSSDRSDLEMTLSLDNAEINLNASAKYYYSKKWVFNNLSVNDVKSIKPLKKAEDVAKGLISKSEIYVNSTTIKLDSDQVKSIELGSITGEDLSKTVKANINLSNGIIKTTVPAEAKLEFNKSDLEWTLNSLNEENKYSRDRKYELEPNVSNKELENYIKAAFQNGINGIVKYKDADGRENTKTIEIYKDNITDFKVTNYKLEDNNQYLRTEVQGKCKNGDLKSYEMSGVITVSVTFGNPSTKLKEINTSNLVTEDLSDNLIKDGLLDKHIKSQIITTDIAKTFKVTNKLQKTPFNTRVTGTIDIGGKTEEIQFYVEMSEKNKQYKWTVNDYINTKDSSSFEK